MTVLRLWISLRTRSFGRLCGSIKKRLRSSCIQRAATIRQADQIIVLDDGAVAGIGKHEELYQNCEVYREICNSQVSAEEEKAHEA